MSQFYANPPSTSSVICPPIQPTIPPKNHFFKNIYGIFLVVTVLAIGVFACLQLVYNTKKSNRPEISNSSKWKTYTNKSLNYSFNYPSNWQVQEKNLGKTSAVEMSPLIDPDMMEGNISIETTIKDLDIESTTFEEYIKKESAQWGDTGYDITKIITQDQTVGYKVSWEVSPEEVEDGITASISTYFEIPGDNSSTIQVLTSNDKYLDVYNKIISSFRFVNSK